ncbi:MAG: tryptophan synthase subunit alpha [Robiginitomaculum sp.]
MTHRIDTTFAALKAENKSGFIAYIMGGDPSYEASLELMKALPDAGVDIIELGMPFTDPAADGPVIELAGLRSIKAGTTVISILKMAAAFRKNNDTTPIILMGYANPVHNMGYAKFAKAAHSASVDGAIIVDLPPEEDGELRAAFEKYGLALIRLATPTTDANRLPIVTANTKGFVYYVSVAGVTGKALGQSASVEHAVTSIRKSSGLPVVVGFGVKTPKQSSEVAKHADAVVVGSAIVNAFHKSGKEAALDLTIQLAKAAHNL